MSKSTDATRRSFLKAGTFAAPVAALAIPSAAIAGDGSKAALVQLQDEIAIEALNRNFLRAFNQGGEQGAANLFAGRSAPAFAADVSRVNVDLAEPPRSFVISHDGASATASYDCTVETAQALEGQETIVQMARMQGNSADTLSARKTLSARYTKQQDGWLISSLELA